MASGDDHEQRAKRPSRPAEQSEDRTASGLRGKLGDETADAVADGLSDAARARGEQPPRRRRPSAFRAFAGRLWDHVYRIAGFLAAIAAIVGLVSIICNDSQDIRIDVAQSRLDTPGYDSPSDEYVCLVNERDHSVSLAGWELHDREGLVNVLPQFELAGHGRVRIHPGPGRDSRTDLYGTAGRATWNNAGDTITLLDEQGQKVAEASYPTQVEGAGGPC